VNWWKTIASLSFLAAWLVTTSYCPLERAGLVAADNCCAESAPVKDTSPAKGCSDEICCNWASPIKITDQRMFVAIPLIPLLPQFLFVETSAAPSELQHSLTAGPPELCSTWQFEQRAVLPVRAPSIVS
jgi:hypothetical protein